MYVSTKTYAHNIGLSCAFRQWRADSHCRLIHGYALQFRFEFQAETLDKNNWVIDFGSLKPLKAALEEQFDHKLLVAENDPSRDTLWELHEQGLADIKIVANVGCEAFAQLGWRMATEFLVDATECNRVRCRSVEVSEHGGNSAIYEADAHKHITAVRIMLARKFPSAEN